MTPRILTILILLLAGVTRVPATAQEPSEFRQFTDKRGQQIEARVLSISEDRKTMELERRDGKTFELEITLLNLDDQQFLRDWLNPPPPATGLSGKLRVFGVLPNEEAINTDALADIADIESIHAMKQGWFVLRKSGDVLTFRDKFPGLTGISHLSVNTVWVALTTTDGNTRGAQGGFQFPDQIKSAVQCAAGNGHYAVLLRDGSVKVFGRRYEEKPPHDPLTPLTDIVALATNQDRVTAVHLDGSVSCWSIGKLEQYRTMLGDGVVEIQGSIFHFLALTRSGEVYEWANDDPEKAKIPPALEGQGPFQKVRCNGSTRAAQREDGTWIAWGMNGAGIVDHINSLGPVPDLAFFSEPGKAEHGYVIWVEP